MPIFQKYTLPLVLTFFSFSLWASPLDVCSDTKLLEEKTFEEVQSSVFSAIEQKNLSCLNEILTSKKELLLNPTVSSEFGTHRSCDNYTVAATKSSSLPILKALVTAGFSVNDKNCKGQTPLHIAAFDNQVDIVRYLIEQKATLDATDSEKRTPIIYAALGESTESLNILINKEANIYHLPSKNAHALNISRLTQDEPSQKLLTEAFLGTSLLTCKKIEHLKQVALDHHISYRSKPSLQEQKKINARTLDNILNMAVVLPQAFTSEQIQEIKKQLTTPDLESNDISCKNLTPELKKITAWQMDFLTQDSQKNLLGKACYTKILKNHKHGFEDPLEQEAFGLYLNAFMQSLDPHSGYFSKNYTNNVLTTAHPISLSKPGVGAEFAYEDCKYNVTDIIPHSPANLAGVQVGDEILKLSSGEGLNFISLKDLKPQEVLDLLYGPKNQSLYLQIERHYPLNEKSGSYKTLKVQKGFPKVNLQIFERKKEDKSYLLALLEIPQFYPNSEADIARVMNKASTQNIQGLVIDLTGNSKGYVPSAVEAAAGFLGREMVVAWDQNQKPLKPQTHNLFTKTYKKPLVVLTSLENSGAAELFIAALKDYRRALIVGDPSSFGYASLQTPFSWLDDREFLVVTTDLLFSPSGKTYQYVGVPAHITLPFSNHTKNVRKALEKRYRYGSPLPVSNTPIFAEEKQLNLPEDFHKVEPKIVESLAELSKNRVQGQRYRSIYTKIPDLPSTRELRLQESVELLMDIIDGSEGT